MNETIGSYKVKYVKVPNGKPAVFEADFCFATLHGTAEFEKAISDSFATNNAQIVADYLMSKSNIHAEIEVRECSNRKIVLFVKYPGGEDFAPNRLLGLTGGTQNEKVLNCLF